MNKVKVIGDDILGYRVVEEDTGLPVMAGTLLAASVAPAGFCLKTGKVTGNGREYWP
jgi:hypothetical protein